MNFVTKIILFRIFLFFTVVLCEDDLPRIALGDEAFVGQFPYHATIYHNGHCGGVLLNSEWVMTARHCLRSDYFLVTAGGIHVAKDEATEQSRNVIKVVPHMGDSDFALLKVDKPFQKTRYVQFVELPDPKANYTGLTAYATGHGTTNGSHWPSILRYTEVEIYDGSECEYYAKNPNWVCAKGKKVFVSNVCQGDSGGPLVLKDKNVLIGILSGAHIPESSTGGCGVNVKVGIWTRITAHLNFIKEVTGIK